MSKVCETAFFAATETGADVFVPKGAIFADDHPITRGRDAHFVSTNETDTPGAVQLNAPDGTPGFPRVEDDGTVTLGPGTILDPVLGAVAHAGETYYTLDRAAEVLVERRRARGSSAATSWPSSRRILAVSSSSPADIAAVESSSSDASSDAGTKPPSTSAPASPAPAKKTAAKKVAAKKP